MTNSHSILPPSGAANWGSTDGCTGWVLMNQLYPEIERSQDSLEGDAAHEVAARLIDQYKIAGMMVGRNEMIGYVSNNGVVTTDEIYDSALIYANDVRSVMMESHVFGGEYLGVEERLTSIPSVHPEQFGKPDCYLYDPNSHTLTVWDFKHGHLLVEAFENWQLINYVAGLLDKFNINGLQDQSLKVRMRVVQPRGFHRDGMIREWSVMASELRGYINTLKMKAALALSDKAEFRTGKQCFHCPGRHACEVALQQGVALFEMVSKPLPVNLSTKALGLQLMLVKRALKQLEGIESGLTSQIEHKIRSGESVPFWKLGQKSTKLSWNMTDEQVIAWGKMCNLDLAKTTALTPVQAKKKGADEEIVKALSSNKSKVSLIEDKGGKFT